MVEAYDLFPVVDCLQLDSFDSVQMCMENLSPWFKIDTETGDFVLSQNALNGFIGGSVGVVGTLLFTTIKKEEVKDRLKCNYCDGTGQIVCGHCLGTGTVSHVEAGTGAVCSGPCQNCDSSGTVVCINCQGSGVTVPEGVCAWGNRRAHNPATSRQSPLP
jgi:hypothetical protein